VTRYQRGRSVTATGWGFGSHGDIIIPSSVFFASLSATLEVTQIGEWASQLVPIATITIPRHVLVLCPYCFSHCHSPSSISFGTDSELTRIESNAFFGCSLKSITIPRHVQILYSYCFSSCNSLSSILFETESELTRIESYSFSSCYSLKSITIPRHVQILYSECFPQGISLSSISFEPESDLARIEARAFYDTSLSSVLVPENTLFDAGTAFPRGCDATAGRRRCRIQ
jgi:hypothetical protein